MLEKKCFFFLRASGMLEKIFCVCQVCLKRFFACVRYAYKEMFFLCVSGILEKKCFFRVSCMLKKKCFFCMCQVCLKRNVYFECVRYA